MQIDPIIAVNDVEASAQWYKSVFGFERQHGGQEFAVLLDKKGEIMLCLHKWGAHDHPTMANQEIISGNGLILYFRTNEMEEIRKNVEQLNYPVEQEIQRNPNSLKREFALRDLDGYFLTVTELHHYKG